MPVNPEIRKDIRAEFNAAASARMNADASKAFRQILKITIGNFAKEAAALKPPVDVWTRPKLRNFILLGTRQIAKEASANATDGVISRKVLNAAGVKVMTTLHKKFCVLRIINNRVQDHRKGHVSDYSAGESEGEVCTTFLETKVI